MTRKIFRSILAVASTIFLLSLLLILGCLYRYFGSVAQKQMEDELSLAAVSVEQNGTAFLKAFSSDRLRLTWIDADGAVLYDTKNDAETLENHADRAEFQSALRTGEGESSRYSTTLLQKTLYRARRLSDGSVLRVSMSRATVGVLLLGMLQPIVLILFAALALSGALAYRLSRRIVAPLNELDLDHPLQNDTYEELAPLLDRLHRQHAQIDRQLRQLQQRTEEFEQITDSLQEGLVLLAPDKTVLSLNPTARRLFSAEDDCVGKSFLTLDRTPALTRAIENALQAGHSEITVRRADRIWQLDLSRIDPADADSDPNGASGLVLLAFDITEKETAQQRRREFTANVSHELKTPLQGIIGSAELIETGLARPEDIPRFVGQIRAEAQRLVSLINDIIRLSQLDEGDALPSETVDLLPLAREVADNLQSEADAHRVTLSVTGDSACIRGIPRLLYEILYNLCDNAIRYNVENGRVSLQVCADADRAVVTVTDTGIGISPEEHERIFERFYRVDKSHSKSSGGTGLGLSIVKHAVLYHHGTLSLQSAPGQGTRVTVTFPRETPLQ